MADERNPNRDDESGRYTEGFTDSDVLEALEALEGVGTTREVADEIGCARKTAYNKLLALDDEGVIDARKTGRTWLWIDGGDA